MAAILSQYSTTGFYKAPVSKGLMGCLFLTCTSINVPLLAHLRKYLVCRLPDVFWKREVWRILTSRTTFLDTKDLVCGALLIYYFRVFERRYGSHKFASYLLATCTLATMLEVVTVLVLQQFDLDFHYGGLLPPGPYGLIFPLFVNYFFDIPRVAQTYILGIPVTGKTLTYLLGLQVCSTSVATAISGACGITAGLAYRYNFLYIQRWLTVPCWLSRISSATLGRILKSGRPPEGQGGATLEIQRQQQLEMLEQQMILHRAREIQRQAPLPMAQGYAERLVGPDGFWGNHNGTVMGEFLRHRGDRQAEEQENTLPSEEQVETLVEMGFERRRVVSALQNANNDIQVATNILLQES